MKQITIYSLKVKIINLYFKIRAIDNPIHFTLALGNRVLDEKDIQIKNGLLKDNISLVCQISQHQMNSTAQIQIRLSQRKSYCYESVGQIKLSFQEFRNVKMRKFKLDNCFDNSAFLQSILLLLPSRVIQQQICQDMKQSKFLHPIESDSLIFDSMISMVRQIKQERKQMDHLKPKIQMLNFLKNTSKETSTQTYTIEGLLALNQTLTKQNRKFQQQNGVLRKKIQHFQQIEKIHINCPKIQSQLKVKINQLQNKVMQKQFELASKEQLIDGLKQQKESLKNQLQKLNDSIKKKQQFKIDSIVAELGKYADTAKKYKSKFINDPISHNQQKVVHPKILLSAREHSIKDTNNSKTTRNRKEQLKNMLMSTRQRDIFGNEETFDTIKETSLRNPPL